MPLYLKFSKRYGMHAPDKNSCDAEKIRVIPAVLSVYQISMDFVVTICCCGVKLQGKSNYMTRHK
jgi:hypothetical protein